MSDWIKNFLSQFGDAVCSDDATSSAQSVLGVVPACVASPDSEEQAAAMIRFAASHKIPVVPCGGGTSQGRCAPPPKGFLALSTRRMNKLIHHEPGDMVATVQAGMRYWDFHTEIAKGGQWLPIDVHSKSTLGGLVAANSRGPRAHGYGTLRDMVLGMTVINGDGVIRKCGGKVVKNVTGYALDKLYIGSFGTLGLITEVTLKLRPLPQCGAFMRAPFVSIDAGIDALRAVASKNLPLEMVRFSTSGIEDARCQLVACATGTHDELVRIVEELLDVVPNFDEGIEDIMQPGFSVPVFSFDRGTWGIARKFITPFKNGATLRIGYTTSVLSSVLKILECNLTQFLSIGLSDAIIDLEPLTDSEAVRISSAFEKLGVNFAFENIVGVNIPNRWGSPRPEWAIMKQLKAALDPQGIMNPGRFVV